MARLRDIIKSHLATNAPLMAQLTGGVHYIEAPPAVRPPYLAYAMAAGTVTPLSLVHTGARTASLRFWVVVERSGPGLATADTVIELLVAALIGFRGLHADIRVHEVDISFGGDTRGDDDYEFPVDAEIVFLGGET